MTNLSFAPLDENKLHSTFLLPGGRYSSFFLETSTHEKLHFFGGQWRRGMNYYHFDNTRDMKHAIFALIEDDIPIVKWFIILEIGDAWEI